MSRVGVRFKWGEGNRRTFSGCVAGSCASLGERESEEFAGGRASELG